MDPDVFWSFFGWFHSLFFSANTWLFEYSDTLIRLFPIRFWQDTFLAAAAIGTGGWFVAGCGNEGAESLARQSVAAHSVCLYCHRLL